jgi:hypothetical protein
VATGPRYGKTGTVWDTSVSGGWGPNATAAGYKNNDLGYHVDIDGLGKYHTDGFTEFAYIARDLRPLTDPNATKFIEEMNKVKETA